MGINFSRTEKYLAMLKAVEEGVRKEGYAIYQWQENAACFGGHYLNVEIVPLEKLEKAKTVNG
jgi:hypothetical protein